MNILLNFLFLFIGYLVSAFGCCQILMTLRVSIPITLEIKKEAPEKNISKLCILFVFTILIWLLILFISTALTYFFTKRISAYLIGFVLALILVFPNTGKTANNVNDFFETYTHLFQ
jgi:hypothetical protein